LEGAPTVDAIAAWEVSMSSSAHNHRRLVAAIGGLIVVLAGCTDGTPSTATLPPGLPTEAVATARPAATGASVATAGPSIGAAFARNPATYVEGASYSQVIDPADFVAGVDHPFLPFVIGMKWIFDGDEHVEVEVLPETKQILGVAATVVRDQVFVDGELAEDTRDWYAQDRDGNVWYFGEQTAEYENGKVTSTAGSWQGGVGGAQPGIIMLAVPQVSDIYRQEFYAGEAEDLATVTALDGSITVPAGSWSGTDVIVTEEWTPLQPEVRERKTYAKGFGVVETRQIKGGHELTTLTSRTLP
jgi:hypothetical protein